MPCSITGSGTSYPEGRIVTGPEALSIHLINDTTDVTTQLPTPGFSAYFSIYMTITDGGTYSVFNPQFGCWGFFVRGGLDTDTYEVEIIKNNSRVVDIALRCNNYTFPAVHGLTSSAVTLRVRVEDGKQGVFLGWHSTPRIGPDPLETYFHEDNNDESWGERELGTGSGSAVVWSSKGNDFVFRYPTWGQRAVWDDVVDDIGIPIDNYFGWCGIDDADYGVSGMPGFAQSQYDGFPNSQAAAPWYCADLYFTNPLCRYIVMRKPIETGVWQFDPEHAGILVCHFNNEWVSPYHEDGVFPFQVFIGAFKYIADSSNDYINEPSASVRTEVLNRVNRLEWPDEPPRVWLSDTATPAQQTFNVRPRRRKRRPWFV